jgi:hypothetical protein
MEAITAPGQDDQDEEEQRAYLKLLPTVGGYWRRHHRVGPDILGPRPQASTQKAGTTCF